MSNDWNDTSTDQPFRKGKAKQAALKPWQSRDGDEVATDKSKCWNGLTGCEEFKGKDGFKWHPMVCNACTQIITARFGMKLADIAMVLIILDQDASLFRETKYLGATAEKLEVLRRTQEIRLNRVLEDLLKSQRNPGDLAAIIRGYREAFRREAGIEIKMPTHVQGMVTPGEAIR